MHVFIDTNILLNFMHFSDDELDSLQNVFASHEHGAAEVHLTQQVVDEFKRNRENKIKDALKKFKDNKFSVQLPSFMKSYSEYDEIRKLAAALQHKRNTILKQVDEDVQSKNLMVDRLVGEIFNNSSIIPVEEKYYKDAMRRVALGNPPGKNSSLGDAVNWVMLLAAVPNKNDIHIISDDGDFYSVLYDKQPHPFLVEEWKIVKESNLYVYRTLTDFMSKHFDGVAFSYDKNKDFLIDNLMQSPTYSTTHGLIAKLEQYSYFSLKEVGKILDAAIENDQFGSIVTDYDVSDFLNRIAMPHITSIENEQKRELLQRVIDEQRDRE